jgi:GntR family transcriptional repressor for pyruvate dehydrogenase complex
MKFKALISPTLSEMFVEEIESMILSGKLSAGEKLPTERELADEMKVSRAVINGGTTELASIGFLEVVPRKGIYVADYKSRGRLEVLQVMLEHSGGRFDAELLTSVLQMREACEQDYARLAAQHRTNADIEAIKARLESIKSAKETAELSETVFDFYRLIAVASRNIVYPLLHSTMRPVYTALFDRLFTVPGQNARLDLFRRLAECIAHSQPEEAAACVHEIIEWTYAALRPSAK